uniref:Uncharacterized protein n=1 Tax=Bracon brevicornis TaxID=1563983 RepID=A0A6V7KNP9_9HYME
MEEQVKELRKALAEEQARAKKAVEEAGRRKRQAEEFYKSQTELQAENQRMEEELRIARQTNQQLTAAARFRSRTEQHLPKCKGPNN